MRKPGCNEENVQMSDVLCDFCMQEWTDERPMVEGHQGSCVCGLCLSAAYRAMVLTEVPVPEAAAKCILCLESRNEPTWSHQPDGPRACRRCVRQSAAVLQKATEFGWRKPEA